MEQYAVIFNRLKKKVGEKRMQEIFDNHRKSVQATAIKMTDFEKHLKNF